MSELDIADPGAVPASGGDPRKPRVALALGAGAAKGLAHIGAIEVLEERGFEIVAIAGTSMGALIGGIYAMGKLDIYRDWVSTLARFDVLRLVDWSFSGGGFIKGDRIMAALRELIGEVNIEELDIAYTAVATDIDREREVWLTRGPLFDAIRASIAIPTLFRPYAHEGRRLVDGALLNPLPVLPLMREDADYVIAVSVDGAAELRKSPEKDVAAVADAGYVRRISRLIGKVLPHGEGKIRDPGAFDLMTQSMDLMQANLSRLRLAAYPPDLLVEIPRNVSAVYEFYRARELIELGRERTAQMLDTWSPRTLAR
ncbi:MULTISPECIES: patatin-like phospholipase family protein [unclassified Luteibacter]|uniref:patatin-like phospholipase family protein n=1 Tax=unclassified Luteibacter TaxID=2620188 RepID=UPI0008BA35FC|nr:MULTISPECIES: patatin-like phospholipase family protein [unclassified Luteibacter]MDR6937557.1 NTE family protein [Luteibacter sp. 3190]SEO36187.1 NTE family protein [Luteibacter sp. UNC138MFCol5.1]SEW23492.1 NTE family protein [Luteibacter sp. 329MFSha]